MTGATVSRVLGIDQDPLNQSEGTRASKRKYKTETPFPLTSPHPPEYHSIPGEMFVLSG